MLKKHTMESATMPSSNISSNAVDPEIKPIHEKKFSKKLIACIVFVVILLGSIIGGILYISRSNKTNIPSVKTVSHTITRSDFGKILQAHSGDTVALQLDIDTNFIETLTVDDPNVLFIQQPLVYDPVSKAFHAALLAKLPGTTKISVLGRPKCLQHAVCPHFIILEFTMNVKVQQ